VIELVVILFLIISTFFVVRSVENSNSKWVRIAAGLAFVFLVLIGWTFYGGAIERHISLRNLGSILLPLVLLGVFLKWNRNLSFGVLVKYFSMPLGFYVSTLLMFEGAVQNSQADIINSMFPAILAAFLSATCLNVVDQGVPRGRLPWVFEVTISILLLISIALFTLTDDWSAPFIHISDWMMVLGLIGSLYLFQSSGSNTFEKFGDAALYATLLVIALNTVMYMDLYDTYDTTEQVQDREVWEQHCLDEPEDSNCEDLWQQQSYSEAESLWNGVANLLSPLICMLGIYLLSILAAITNNQTEKIVRKNWHLAEGFVFVIFVYFAPFSMLEFGS